MALLIALFANVIGGATYAIQKVALEGGWTPAALVFVRLMISLPFAWAWAPRGWRSQLTRADRGRILLVATLGYAAPLLLGVYGLAESESSSGAILIGMEPVSITVLAHFFLGEPLRRRQLLGIALALSGALLVVSKGDWTALWSQETSVRGTVLLALHGVLWGVYTVGAKPTLARIPASVFTAATSSFAVLAVAPLATMELAKLDVARALDPLPLACVLSLGIGVSWGCSVLWNYSLARLPATTMAALVFLQPLTGVLLGALLGERLVAASLAGGVLVLLGVWIGAR